MRFEPWSSRTAVGRPTTKPPRPDDDKYHLTERQGCFNTIQQCDVLVQHMRIPHLVVGPRYLMTCLCQKCLYLLHCITEALHFIPPSSHDVLIWACGSYGWEERQINQILFQWTLELWRRLKTLTLPPDGHTSPALRISLTSFDMVLLDARDAAQSISIG